MGQREGAARIQEPVFGSQRFIRRGGLQNSAQGFNVGPPVLRTCAPKASPERGLFQSVVVCKGNNAYTVWRPFRARRKKLPDPGSKPRAESFYRFAVDYTLTSSAPDRVLP